MTSSERVKRWRDANPEKVRGHHLKQKYGLTLVGYEELWQHQNELCAACGSNVPRGGRWHLDHCHSSGTVRGIICAKCNHALGMVDDSTDLLLDLINYLKHRRG